MAIQDAGDSALLHLIAAVLSLLLLAGAFGRGVDSEVDAPAAPVANTADPRPTRSDGAR